MVFPSVSKFPPLCWAPLSPLWHLSSKQRASVFHFSYLMTLPLLIWTIFNALNLLLSLASIFVSFFEVTVIFNYWPFLIKALEEIFYSLVVTCSHFLKFFRYKWGQSGKLFFLGRIFLVYVDLMSFPLAFKCFKHILVEYSYFFNHCENTTSLCVYLDYLSSCSLSGLKSGILWLDSPLLQPFEEQRAH